MTTTMGVFLLSALLNAILIWFVIGLLVRPKQLHVLTISLTDGRNTYNRLFIFRDYNECNKAYHNVVDRELYLLPDANDYDSIQALCESEYNIVNVVIKKEELI